MDVLRRIPLIMVLTSVLAGLGIVQMTFLIGHGLYRFLDWSAQTRQVQQSNHQLRQDIEVLDSVRRRADDPDFLRELARCQGFVGAGEQVVVDQAATAPEEGGNCETVTLP